jgi:hypothetical protein
MYLTDFDRLFSSKTLYFFCEKPTDIDLTEDKMKEKKADLLLKMENTGITDEWYED